MQEAQYDLTKAFDLIRREGLFKILSKVGFPPKRQSHIDAFQINMAGTVQYDGIISGPFGIYKPVYLLQHFFQSSSAHS